jgi:hypothetical protein
MFKNYCLLILKRNGETSRHYYEDYDSMDYDATMCQFSLNVAKARGMRCGSRGWKTLFKIG